MFKFISKLFDSNEKAIGKVRPVLEEINEMESDIEKLSQEDMQKRVREMREEIKPLVDKITEEQKNSLRAVDRSKGFAEEEVAIQDKLKELMPEYYAILREHMKRSFKRRHYDVQIIAGLILADGQKLTELKTGEGKTQVFHLPLSLYALTRRGAHAITVNDYLARRDGEYAGHVLSPLGFTVGVITPQGSFKFIPTDELDKHLEGDELEKAKNQSIFDPGDVDGLNLVEVSKKEAYDCDIVYGTNNEFGFDYLRDNMSQFLERIVQRELYFCIIDEADSILIDEARTPLIISAPAEKSNELYQRFAAIVPKLKEEDDFTVDEKAHSVVLTDNGTEKVEGLLGVDNVWQDYRLAHHLENALKAQVLYTRDKEYLVKNGEVMIVDSFTGRVLPGRRYSEGLHQAIEAKEGVEIKRESKTLATITFQNFFRLYKILNGASGTIMTEAEEFYKIYNLESFAIPTNKPVIRKDHTDRVYKNSDAKFNAVAEEIREINETGQPILVGTTSIEDSETVSKKLDKLGVKHEVLNAKFHERESKIVANAGRKGSVTVATNMAGRGTDIKLGGQNAPKEAKEEVMELGGLYVIGTERHDARRVDNQLRGRSGRQGEPGESRFYVSLDDQIMRIQGGGMVQRLMEMTNIPEDMPIEAGIIGSSIENAQKKMEGHHFDIRKRLVEYDDVMNQQREIFYTRRRGIVELAENAKGKYSKGRDVIIEEDSKKIESKREEIRENLQNYLNEEIDFIVDAHYFDDREDEKDAKKVVDQILDLSPDRYISDAVDDKVGVTKIGEYLVEKIKDKEKDEVKSYFNKLFQKVAKVKFEEYGKDIPDVTKKIVLESMDEMWTNHIETMRDLREGIGLRGYAQRDPLVEYKNEAFEVFQKFIGSINSEIARRVLKLVRVQNIEAPSVTINTNEDQISDVLTGTREMLAKSVDSATKNSESKSGKSQKQVKKVVAVDGSKYKDVGRNDPCPCGSGKKFKKCHGKAV